MSIDGRAVDLNYKGNQTGAELEVSQHARPFAVVSGSLKAMFSRTSVLRPVQVPGSPKGGSLISWEVDSTPRVI